MGAHVLATDFRDLPLQLLRRAARRQQLPLRTAQLDVCAAPLPSADVVVASDVLYAEATARAMAHRVAEAYRKGSVRGPRA